MQNRSKKCQNMPSAYFAGLYSLNHYIIIDNALNFVLANIIRAWRISIALVIYALAILQVV